MQGASKWACIHMPTISSNATDGVRPRCGFCTEMRPFCFPASVSLNEAAAVDTHKRPIYNTCMKLKPLANNRTPAYPVLNSHFSSRRQFLNTIGQAGIAVSLCALSARTIAAETETDEEQKKRVEAELNDIRNKVASLSKDLNHKDFKARKDATAELIKIGTPELKEGKDIHEAAREIVLDKMKELEKHEDPEVKMRAIEVTAALTPKPPPVVDDRPALGGVMLAPQMQR